MTEEELRKEILSQVTTNDNNLINKIIQAILEKEQSKHDRRAKDFDERRTTN